MLPAANKYLPRRPTAFHSCFLMLPDALYPKEKSKPLVQYFLTCYTNALAWELEGFHSPTVLQDSW